MNVWVEHIYVIRFLAYYRCTIKTNKWPMCVFSHFINLTAGFNMGYFRKLMTLRNMSTLEDHMIDTLSILNYESNKANNK